MGRVQNVSSFGEGVYQVDFTVPSRATRFHPGQFLHLTLDEFDPTTGYWPESRVFSIASEPRQDQVTIVYSVKGAYTRRMEAELVPDREVWLKLPYGDFVIEEALLSSGPVALVAGGTGVSPYWPFLKKHAERSGAVHLFYGVRRPEHILFAAELEALKATPWFHLHLMIEVGAVTSLPFSAGRLSVEAIVGSLGAEAERAHYFLSGPPVMIQNFKRDLLLRGMEGHKIHIDEWE